MEHASAGYEHAASNGTTFLTIHSNQQKSSSFLNAYSGFVVTPTPIIPALKRCPMACSIYTLSRSLHNMKPHPKPSDFAALVGIDWADKKHDICEVTTDGGAMKFDVILSSPKSIIEWANNLKLKYPNQPIAVACELKKGPLIYALEQFDHIVLFPVNPQTVVKYRKAFTVSGAKDDPSDAKVIMELLQTHMHKLSPLFPQDPAIRALAQLTESRRSLVQDRVALANKITSALKNYNPQVLQWFSEKDTLIFCDFLIRWPTLEKAKKAHRSTLLKFFDQHNSRYPAVNQKRIDEIKSAIALTSDPGV